METVVVQTNPSQVTDEKQIPVSAQKKVIKKKTNWSRDTGLDGTFMAARAPTVTSVRKGFMIPDVPSFVEVEEYFEGFVEEITDLAVRLRTISSENEEGVAWLEIKKIPPTERMYIALGAPVRISIVLHRGYKMNDQRRTDIRFLRPSQWRQSEGSEAVVSYLLEKMKAVLG